MPLLPLPQLPDRIAPMTTVYSYYLPEVRPIVDRLVADYPHDVFLANLHPGLDDLHVPLFDAFCSRYADQVTGWDALAHRYPTGGSSEALFHLITEHATHRRDVPLYQLRGEYQGYEAYTDAVGLPLITMEEEDLVAAAPGVVVLSHPSARDGNLLDEQLLAAIMGRHRVILDLAYLGMTRPLGLDVSHPNVEAVVTSFSKPFGLYYHRIGLTFTRQPVASLYGTKWFKNALSILLAQRILEQLPAADVLLGRYQDRQRRALAAAARDGFDVRTADVWLLGRADGTPARPELEEFRRGRFYRLCLTPYLMAQEHVKEI
jgi:hypothetical protein